MKNRKGVSEMCCRSLEGEVPAPLSLQVVEQHKVLTLVASANFCALQLPRAVPVALEPGSCWNSGSSTVPGHATAEWMLPKDFSHLPKLLRLNSWWWKNIHTFHREGFCAIVSSLNCLSAVNPGRLHH